MVESTLTAATRREDWAKPRVFLVRALGNAMHLYIVVTILSPWFFSDREWHDTATLAVLYGLVSAGPRPRWVQRLRARMVGESR